MLFSLRLSLDRWCSGVVMGKNKKPKANNEQKNENVRIGFLEYYLNELYKDYETNRDDQFGFATAGAKQELLQVNEYIMRGYLTMVQKVSNVPFVHRPQFLELCNLFQFKFCSKLSGEGGGMKLSESVEKELKFLHNEEEKYMANVDKPKLKLIKLSEHRNALIKSFETMAHHFCYHIHLLEGLEKPWSSQPMEEAGPMVITEDESATSSKASLEDKKAIPSEEDENDTSRKASDTQVCNVEVQIISANKGKLNLSNKEEQWIDVSIERIDNEDLTSQYAQNLKITRGHPHIIRLEYLLYNYTDNAFDFLVERYNSTLSELVRNATVEEMWEKVGLDTFYSAWRLSPFFQKILENILKGLVFLLENNIAYEVSLESVVFLESDAKHENPKLRYLSCFDGQCSAKRMFAYLRAMIDTIIKKHQRRNSIKDIGEDVDEKQKPLGHIHKDVLHFQIMLRDNPFGTQTILKHPVMWRSPNKLDFIVHVRNLIHYGKLELTASVQKTFLRYVKNWITEANKHPYLCKRIEYANKLKNDRGGTGDAYNGSLFSVISFIRDNFEHINEEMKKSDSENKGENDGQLVVEKVEKWTWEQVDELFESLFPTLACILHAYITTGR